MPAFETPSPISVDLDLVAAEIDITGSDRTDTVVTVRPGNESEASARAAEQTTVHYRNGKLAIRTPKPRRGLFSRSRSAEDEKDSTIVVAIELPAGSDLSGEAALGYLTARGRLGEFRFSSACGNVWLEEAGSLRVDAALGDVNVGRVTGGAEITTTQGNLKVDVIGGAARIKNLSGTTALGDVAGDLRVTATNGEVSVGRVSGDVEAKNTNGDIYLGEVAGGEVDLETTRGSIGVGIPEGVAAHLDARSLLGGVYNGLQDSAAPERQTATVQLRTRTVMGEIKIHRA
ncbi:DUF4097 family beta strand repeat-containing protein [Streptomyces malaysiense]|uniref:DUF4097 domain-containing protein n=1 Tax=Streptomyces malaysiense TaxID=1428626 RepID=A0A1J4Q7U4_9ACTN|nr:DUF4097 family beta strand repeat-containing protein [Streptomyces malaysiense]OIK28199.1 hypothetical protein VT52_007535 [Streptomyces malaysiense]